MKKPLVKTIKLSARKRAVKQPVLRVRKITRAKKAAGAKTALKAGSYKISVRVVKFAPGVLSPKPQAPAFGLGHFARALGRTAFKASASALLAVLVLLPLFSGFEAHIVSISAEPVRIDPPVLTLPGAQIPWHNPIGATGLSGSVDIVLSAPDADATHIYFNLATGTDPS